MGIRKKAMNSARRIAEIRFSMTNGPTLALEHVLFLGWTFLRYQEGQKAGRTFSSDFLP